MVISPGGCCPIVELRHYTLRPGKRETLIELFDREFIETQESAGMQLIAQFRDIDRPDVFTWLRGFENMQSRAVALAAFYDGPTWRAHCDVANSTMIDSDNVLLLRPARPESGFVFDTADRPGVGATTIPRGLFVATIYSLAASAANDFGDAFDRVIIPELTTSGAAPIAVLETEPTENTFPRLPVREGEHAFVWFARFADVPAYEQHVAALQESRTWREEVRPTLDSRLTSPVETWRLTPTARSRVFG
jgi:quinol monooxygenase YgiN